MLAQAFEIQSWHLVLFVFGGVGSLAVKWGLEVLAARSKERREEKRDDEHTSFLRKISTSNEQAVREITTLNERMAAERQIQDIHHSENVRLIISGACKYQGECKNFEQKNQT